MKVDFSGIRFSKTWSVTLLFFIASLNAFAVDVGSGNAYTTLRAAFDAINAGTLKGDVVLEITSNLTETGSAVLNASGTGGASYTSVVIRPKGAARTISTSTSFTSNTLNMLGLLTLNSAKNVTIDGRVDGTGTASGLTIQHRGSGSSTYNNALVLKGDASDNVIRYTTLRCEYNINTDNNKGIILFYNPANVSPVPELKNNTIEYCNFDGAASSSAISAVTINAFCSNTTISDNNFYGLKKYGIQCVNSSSGVIVSRNSFYGTEATYQASSTGSSPIYINNFNTAQIIDNFIGGTAPKLGGGRMSFSAGGFLAIHLGASSATVPAEVQGNQIGKIDYTSLSSGTVCYMISVQNCPANIGTTSPNLIGSSSAQGNIVINQVNTYNGECGGIYVTSTRPMSIANNSIGGIRIEAEDPARSMKFYGITNRSSNATIQNNLIGSTLVSNSIENNTGHGATVDFVTSGIYSNNSSTTNVLNNTISNISATSPSERSSVVGIYCNSRGIITNNTIKDLYSSSTSRDATSKPALAGIYCPGGQYSGNRISNLSALAASADTRVYGIRATAANTQVGTIEKNFVHHISNASSSAASYVIGIDPGGALVKNNMVQLGYHTDGTPQSSSSQIYGIYFSSLMASEAYHNSVFIGGLSSAAAGKTAAIYSKINGTSTAVIKNNILVNNRSGSGVPASNHIFSFEDAIAGATFTVDNNIYQNTGVGNIFAVTRDRSYPDYSSWRELTDCDFNSYYKDPKFKVPEGSTQTVDLHLQQSNYAEGRGVAIADITEDFAGNSRNVSTPDIGADEGEFTLILSAPEVVIKPVSATTATSANLAGAVNDAGAATTVTFEYGTNSDISDATVVAAVPNTINAGTGTTNVSAAISGLVSGTTYYYRVSAANTLGTTKGTIRSFETDVVLPANLTTFDNLYSGTFNDLTGPGSAASPGRLASNVSGYDLRVVSSNTEPDAGIGIEPFTGQTPLAYAYTNSGATNLLYLELSVHDGRIFDLQSIDIVVDGTGSSVPKSVKLTGYRNGNPVNGAVLMKMLADASLGGQLVTYETSANNSFVGIDKIRIEPEGSYTISGAVGIDNVQAVNFRTPPAFTIPSATTVAVTTKTTTTATLAGTVSDGGAETTVTFDFGTNSDLTGASSVNAVPNKIAAGSGSTGVSAAITALTAGTTYYYRVKAVNSAGTKVGEINSFTTDLPPSTTVASIVRAGNNPTNSAAVFTVTFAGYVTGVDAADFTVIPGPNMSSASVGSVTGSGKVYTVTVNYSLNAGFSSSSLRLDFTELNGVSPNVTTAFTSGEPYTIDIEGPAAPVLVVLADGTHTNDNEPTFSGTAEPGSTIQLYINGVLRGPENIADGSGNWVITPLGTYLDGANTVTATATDAAGNTSPQSTTNTFFYDVIAPKLTSITRQTPLAVSTNADNLTFRVTFSEKVSGVTAAHFSVTGTVATIGTLQEITEGTVFDVPVSGGNLASFEGDVSLSLNTTSNIKDAAQNGLASATPTGANERYTLDNTAPVISGVVNNQTYTVNKTVSFNEGTATLNGSAFTSGSTISTEGLFTLTVTDAAGNSTTVSFEIDKTPPQTKPVFTSSPITTAVENVPYVYGAVGVDADGDQLTFTAPVLPSWLTFSPSGQDEAVQFGNSVASPGGVVGDAEGNIYIAQLTGRNIYKITPDGTTSLWAVKGTLNTGATYSLLIVGNYLYIGYYNATVGYITRIALDNPDAGEQQVFSSLNTSYAGQGGVLGMVERGGYLYAAMYYAGKVMRMSLTDFSTSDYVTGLGTSQAFGLGFDAAGDLYITAYQDRGLYKWNGTTRTTVLSSLPNSVSDVKIDPSGNIYLSLQGNPGSIRKYKSDLSTFTTIANNVSAWGMALTPNGALVFGNTYGISSKQGVFRIQTGATIAGTPTHAEVGVHPVTIRMSDGTNTEEQSFSITVTDPNPPTVTALSPANNATGITNDANLTITFNEQIKKGTGFISIRRTSDNSLVEQIDAGGSQVSITGATLTIDPAVSLPVFTNLYIAIDSAAILDVNNNPYAGISEATTWRFQTQKADQVITFAAAADVTYGTADFDPGATSTGTEAPITYTSSDPTVAAIVDNKVHILKTGTTVITASQAGSTSFNPAVSMTQTLTVIPKSIVVNLTASPVITKVYDGTNTAAVSTANFSIAGLINGDEVTASATAQYDNKDAGTGKIITASSIVLSGAQKDNYTLSNSTATITGVITAKPLTLSLNAIPAITKVYDGSLSASLAPANYTITGIITGDEVSATATASYDTKDVGAGKAITANTFVLDGPHKANYSLINSTVSTTGAITAKPITLTLNAEPVITKVYDGTTGVNLAPANYSLTGVVAGDQVVATATASFDTKDAGTGKTIAANTFVLDGLNKANYSLLNSSASTTGLITAKPITLSLNGTPAITKVYDGTRAASLAPANYNLTGIVAGDEVGVSGSAVYDTKDAGNGKTVTATDLILSGAQKENYQLTGVSSTTNGTVSQRKLIVTADSQTRSQGLPNPVFSLSYTGFIAGEDETVLAERPTASTVATADSPAGTYPITLSGGSAVNYEISPVNGTLTVTAGFPTSITLAAAMVFENAPVGTLAGTLSSTSVDPGTTFKYRLVAGAGDTDNGLFEIADGSNEIRTKVKLNYENQSSYRVRVRSIAKNSMLHLDREFTIAINDVNESPTINTIANSTICYTPSQQTIALSNISPGPEANQTVGVSVSSSNNNLFESLTVSRVDKNGCAELRYKLAPSASGAATVTVSVQDDGGTANGGVDLKKQSFTLTVCPLPVVTITSDKGTSLSRGEVAVLQADVRGGNKGLSYSWADAHGIVSVSKKSATLDIRPAETTTYTVKVTNSNGCVSTQSITIEVEADFAVVRGTNIISPNGDGVNDNLVIRNIDMYPNNVVKIFDRAGRLLYSKTNYSNEFDGTFQGSPLAEDTYYYIVDFGPGNKKIKGFVTIVRD